MIIYKLESIDLAIHGCSRVLTVGEFVDALEIGRQGGIRHPRATRSAVRHRGHLSRVCSLWIFLPSPRTLAKMASSVDAKLIRRTKFPPEFNKKVDMTKVNIEVMKKYVTFPRVFFGYLRFTDIAFSPTYVDGSQVKSPRYWAMRMTLLSSSVSHISRDHATYVRPSDN